MIAARKSFVAALEKAREDVVHRDPTKRSEGPNKMLAALIRVSPGRVGDFLSPHFYLLTGPTKNDEKAGKFFSAARLHKALAGFAASVERTLKWLQSTKLPDLLPESLTVEQIVEGYWPSHVAGLEGHFSHDQLRSAVEAGRAAAATETANLSKIRVTLWIPAWGGWEKWDCDPKTGKHNQETAYLSSYGKALLRAIDPVDAKIEQQSKKYSETFQLPMRSKESGLVLAMGLFDELSRRFRGFEFVTFPILRFPPIGLVVHARGYELKRGDKVPVLEDLLKLDYPHLRCVVEHDVGASLLRSMFLDDPDESCVEVLPDSNLREIPRILMAHLRHRERVAFVADGSLSFEVFCALREKGYHVDVHAQGLEPVFAYQNGVMFRNEDREFASLLHSAQHHLFRTPWRIVRLLEIYMNAMSEWIKDLNPTSETLSQWPEKAPIFLVSAKDMQSYMRNDVKAPNALIERGLKGIEEMFPEKSLLADPELAFLRDKLFRLERAEN